MRRRKFLAALGGAVASPSIAWGQQPTTRLRRMAVLMGYANNDPIVERGLAGLLRGLDQIGWRVGANLQIEYRWTDASVEAARQAAQELVDLKPDLILTATTPATAAVKQQTTSIPIVFVMVSDPVGAGFVETLARPNGNITGFINFEDAIGGKWLELLMEIAPTVKQVVIMFNPNTAPGHGEYFLPSFLAAAGKMGVTAAPAKVHTADDVKRSIAALAEQRGSGLVVMSDAFLVVHLNEVIKLSALYKIPTIYGLSSRAKEGGLISYSPDLPDLFERAADYVNRILSGERPGELPVQTPIKYQLTINQKTAKALGLTVSPSLLAQADEVIE